MQHWTGMSSWLSKQRFLLVVQNYCLFKSNVCFFLKVHSVQRGTIMLFYPPFLILALLVKKLPPPFFGVYH